MHGWYFASNFGVIGAGAPCGDGSQQLCLQAAYSVQLRF